MSTSEMETDRQPWAALVQAESSSERRQRSRDLRQLAPCATLVSYLQEALTVEIDEDIASDLISAVLRHEGKEEEDGGTFYYSRLDLDEVYEQALKSAVSVEVRCALHRGRAEFTPRDSKIGRTSLASLLEQKCRAATDLLEQFCLAAILNERAGYSGERLLALVERWMEIPLNGANADGRLCLWAVAVKQARDTASAAGWRALRDSESIRQQAVRKVQNHLQDSRDSEVRSELLKLLAGDLYGADCDPTLHVYLEDADVQLRRVAIIGLAKTGECGKEKLRVRLRLEGDSSLIDVIRNTLHEAGDDDIAIIRNLACNPQVDSVAESLLHSIRESREWPTLRVAWPGLSADLRDAIERHWIRDLDRHHFHHPFWHELFWEFHEAWRGNLRDSGWAVIGSLISRSVLEIIGAYDFDGVTGLRRRAAVTFRTIPTLRFGFLVQARTREGQPVSAMLEQRQIHIVELLQVEREFDITRDRHAAIRAEVDARARQLGDDVVAEMRRWSMSRRSGDRPGGRGPEKFGAQGIEFTKLEEQLLSLDAELSLDSEQSHFSRLRRESAHLLPFLQETGCSLDGIPGPDGILGEYQPRDRSITIFSSMISLAAADAHARLRATATIEGVVAAVRTIVEAHELAHAQIHLGEDTGGRTWETLGAVSRGFHEAFAQLYTRKVIRTLDEPGLNDVLDVTEGWLLPTYRHADRLQTVDTEEVRSYLLRRRRQAPPQELVDVVASLLRSLPSYLSMLRVQLPRRAWTDALESVCGVLDQAITSLADPVQGPVALEELLLALMALPQAGPILGAFVPGGLPDAERLRWLVFECLVTGEPVGDGALRYLRAEDFVAAVESSKPSAVLGLRAGITEARMAIEEVRTLGRTSSDDRIQHPVSGYLAAVSPGDST